MTTEYKLYRNGQFFSLKNDLLEETPLDVKKLNESQYKIYSRLTEELNRHPNLE